MWLDLHSRVENLIKADQQKINIVQIQLLAEEIYFQPNEIDTDRQLFTLFYQDIPIWGGWAPPPQQNRTKDTTEWQRHD